MKSRDVTTPKTTNCGPLLCLINQDVMSILRKVQIVISYLFKVGLYE